MINHEGLLELEAMRKEPLHPDLVPYLADGPFGTALYHPLVHDPIHHINGLANRQYLHKREALMRAVSEERWHDYVFIHERPYRVHALVETAEYDDTDMAARVRNVWTDSENIWQNLDDWSYLLTEYGMAMTEVEESRLTFFADRLRRDGSVRVWRGHNERGTANGWSWTIDRRRAEWFACRFSTGQGTVTQGVVQRADVIALLLSRGEDEIVCDPDMVRIEKQYRVDAK